MHLRKRVAIPLTLLVISFLLAGCSSQYYGHSFHKKSNTTSSISISAYEQADSEEAILELLLNTMKNNSNRCFFSVTSMDLIDTNSWLKKLNGIESIRCEYRRIRNGYNIVVSLKYWDNYSIINAYRTGSTEELTSKQLELYNKYLSVLSEYTSDSATQWENEIAIHDYLVSNIKYEDGDGAIYNAYDALINGTAVCNGYTECFKTFMDMLGIECIAISGTAKNELHIWNLVKLDGEWYQVDVTWDDPVNGDDSVEHAYFNITSDSISVDHIWDSSLYPDATGTRYSYPSVMKLPSIETTEHAVEFFRKHLSLRTNNIEFTSSTVIDIKSALEQCGFTVAYSYRTFNYSSYSLYELSFDYN